MPFTVLIQWCEHDGKDDLDIVANEIAEVLVVPEVQRAFGDLKVRASDRFGELMEERLLHLGKFGWIHDFKDVLHFIEKHDLLGAVDLGPVAKKAEHDLTWIR